MIIGAVGCPGLSEIGWQPGCNNRDIRREKIHSLPEMDLDCPQTGERYGLNPRTILTELGRRQAVAGQEDWILDVALKAGVPVEADTLRGETIDLRSLLPTARPARLARHQQQML